MEFGLTIFAVLGLFLIVLGGFVGLFSYASYKSLRDDELFPSVIYVDDREFLEDRPLKAACGIPGIT